jgi:hypothetical protein
MAFTRKRGLLLSNGAVDRQSEVWVGSLFTLFILLCCWVHTNKNTLTKNNTLDKKVYIIPIHHNNPQGGNAVG